jgi:hypothetical protein
LFSKKGFGERAFGVLMTDVHKLGLSKSRYGCSMPADNSVDRFDRLIMDFRFFGGAGIMKKLMSLMLVCAAAFAGGGMLNEHNFVTAVNYIYHKQQVGRVISLGSITGTPAAELPEVLPSTPGAVPTAPVAGAATAPPAGGASPPLLQTPATQAQAATQSPAPVVPPPSLDQAYQPTPIPSRPQPPLEIKLPSEDQISAVAQIPVKQEPETPAIAPLRPGPFDAPAAPESLPRQIAANVPEVGSALAGNANEMKPKRDDAVTRSGFDSQNEKIMPEKEPTWAELVEKMRSLGLKNIELQVLANGQLKLKSNLINNITGKQYEIAAEGTTPEKAAQVAIRRTVLYQASAKSNRSQNQPEPVATAPKRLGRINDEPLYSVPPPAAPLEAPVDLPPPADLPPG